MSRGKSITKEERKEVIRLHEAKVPILIIASQMKRHKQTIYNIIWENNENKTVQRKSRKSRKALSKDDKLFINDYIMKNSRASGSEIQAALKERGTPVSLSPIFRYLKSIKCERKKGKKPKLNEDDQLFINNYIKKNSKVTGSKIQAALKKRGTSVSLPPIFKYLKSINQPDKSLTESQKDDGHDLHRPSTSTDVYKAPAQKKLRLRSPTLTNDQETSDSFTSTNKLASSTLQNDVLGTNNELSMKKVRRRKQDRPRQRQDLSTNDETNNKLPIKKIRRRKQDWPRKRQRQDLSTSDEYELGTFRDDVHETDNKAH